jgi:ATP adenylyltransferase
MKDCPFCNISNTIICDSALVIAFYDGYRTSPGHALVMPRRHVQGYFECKPDEKAALWEMVETVRRILEERKPDGFNIGFNVGKASEIGDVVSE